MNLETRTHKLFVARQEAAANSDFSDNLATKGNFANRPDGSVDVLDLIRLDPTVDNVKDPKIFANTIVNGIVFYFAGGDAPDDTFEWNLYAWRNENGPAELVANGIGTLGTQAVVTWPHNDVPVADRFWADTIQVDNEYWVKEIEATAQDNNSVSKLWMDIAGCRYFYIEIPASVGKMSAYIGYF